MVFPENITYWGNAVLRHDSANNKSFIYFINRQLGRKDIDAKTIDKVANEYKLLFCNHFVETSHFVNFISNNRLARNYKNDFFHYLFLYFEQFYPDYVLLKDINDEKELISLFDNCYNKINNLLGQFLDGLDNNDLQSIRGNIEAINKIYDFYNKIEDFMIRFYGYSIIGISNQKYIITACSNCDKKFIDQLLQGYSLFRLQRLVFVNEPVSHFEFSPVLPTKDVGFPIDEYIEISDTNNSIINKKMVKILK